MRLFLDSGVLRHARLLLALVLGGAGAPALLHAPAVAAQTARVELQTGKMWTFENPPVEYLKREYGFEASPEWVGQVRLAALRFGALCSASFVSPEGLVMTNHHCARSCIAAVSPAEVDYVAKGFYAAEREDERQCPGLFLDQLVAFEDVTDRVEAAVPPRADEAVATEAKREEARRMEEECQRAGTVRCQVVSLYHGGRYSLYRYKRYTDVRLVFAPEVGIAFFGGDPDNFTYPRHDLDVAFVRAYETGAPATTPHYFRWSRAGAREGDLVFVVGNPGSTGRLNTLGQLERLRDDVLPAQLKALNERLAILRELAGRSADDARKYQNDIFGSENSIKAFTGYLSGLLDPTLMARKAAWERTFRDAVERDPVLRKAYGDAWEKIARVQRERVRAAAKQRTYLYGGSSLFARARSLVEYVLERARPSEERLPDYRDPNLARVAERLQAAPPVDLPLEERVLAVFVANARATLAPDDPLARALGPGAPEEVARTLVQRTRLTEEDGRKAVLEAEPQALAASQDPLIRIARAVAPEVRKLRQRLAELDAIESANEERV
ncbi:MAG: S46 family peptidase, partial [Gemmatimonadetes bacterium]|nr:S46 family peptidase [Gemmatimonadota bacterium]